MVIYSCFSGIFVFSFRNLLNWNWNAGVYLSLTTLFNPHQVHCTFFDPLHSVHRIESGRQKSADLNPVSFSGFASTPSRED